MMNIKKTLIALCGAAVMSMGIPAAAATPVTYTKTSIDGYDATYGTLKAESYDIAVRIDDASLRGSRITGVRVPMPDTKGLTSAKAFITKELKTGKVDGIKQNVADVESVEAVFADGCLTATFKEGYTLDESPVYVGYSFTVSELTEINRKPVAGKSVATPGGFYVRTSRTKSSWTDMAEQQQFTSTMGVLLEGEFSAVGAALRVDNIVFAEQHKAFQLPVVLTNQGTEPITSLEYSWTMDGQSGVGTYEPEEPVEVAFGREYSFNFLIDVDASKGYKDLSVTLDKINGKENNATDRSATHQIRVVSLVPVHRPLTEEYTGIWCGFCPRGMAAMEHMRAKYKDDFICAVYHISSGNNLDPAETTIPIPNSPGSFPTCFIDRWDKMDPYHGKLEGDMTVLPQTFAFEKFWLRTRDEFCPVAVETKATWADENQTSIKVQTEVSFVDVPEGKFGIGYLLVSDDIRNPDSPFCWLQRNSLMGMLIDIPEIKMFSQSGTTVALEKYDDVALSGTGENPVPGSLPEELVADEVYTHNYTIPCVSIKGQTGVELIQDRNKLRVIAVVIDRETKRAINAAQSFLDPSHMSGVDGVDNVATDAEVIAVEYYDMAGVRHAVAPKGVGIVVTRRADGSSSVEKIYTK